MINKLFYLLMFSFAVVFFTSCERVPDVELYPDVTSGVAPLVVKFTTNPYGYGQNGYNWDFGDGEFSYDPESTSHTYTKAGTYTVTLAVNFRNKNSSDTRTITVTALQLSTVSTTAMSNIAATTAIGGGNVTSDGGIPVISRGICYNTLPTPTITNSIVTSNGTTGSFTCNLINLSLNTKYYVRAYVTNSIGTVYGNEINFTTLTNTIVDGDGNIYTKITIGTQTWLKENLKTTKYNDGTAITNVTNATTWTQLTTPAYCWYNNDAAYKNVYGALYNWYTVDKASNGNKNICPTGYHVPTDAEWTTLTTYLGGESVAGGKMKETGTTHWLTPNTGATNESGFTALPGGCCNGYYGEFYDVGKFSNFWSSDTDAFDAWGRGLWYRDATSSPDIYEKRGGFSVRCVKD